jgi:hypothetical protein
LNWGDIFCYDETSPSFLRWKIDRFTKGRCSRKNVSAGDKAGSISGCHWIVSVEKKNFCVHRIIYELHFGEIPEDKQIDHIDRSGLNNKIDNLRCVDRQFNQRNMRKSTKNSSGFTGVGVYTKRGIDVWYGTVNKDGKAYSKHFSSKKYGDGSRNLAIAWRKEKIEELNSLGFGYTKEHGT